MWVWFKEAMAHAQTAENHAEKRMAELVGNQIAVRAVELCGQHGEGKRSLGN